jgi:hypothetical protein
MSEQKEEEEEDEDEEEEKESKKRSEKEGERRAIELKDSVIERKRKRNITISFSQCTSP